MRITTNGTYIITGGGGGIAAHVARIFADAGAKLALVDVREDTVQERANEVGALAVEADLTTAEGAEKMVEATLDRFGSLDGLIHTAGGFAMAPAHSHDRALYDRLFDINVRTLVVSTGAVLPRLIERGGGFLAAFSAMPVWQRSGGGGMSVYAASKAAVAAFVRAVDDEAGGRGVHTAIVYPMGAVDTPDNRKSMPDADRSGWIEPDEIGRALLFAATRGGNGRLTELPISV
jgi:NADP-dependent 3-hydroxy acid dehydrogenase YdfG